MAVASRCSARKWRNDDVTWEDFVAGLRQPRRTDETLAEYAEMSPDERGRAKDGPAVVAGYLEGGRRGKTTVTRRSMIALDSDDAGDGLMDDVELMLGCAAVGYETHSSTRKVRRMRVFIPLSRDVTPDEYVACAQQAARLVGLDRFDSTTFQPERLMYLPNVCKDAPYALDVREGEPLDPDWLLGAYEDWRDASSWPVAMSRPSEARTAGDPREKPGLIGEFCRAYTVPEAIERFIPQSYKEAGRDRWTYAGGSTRGGMVVYDGGLWCYSNHATDPAATGHLVCAYDIVRLHRFGGDVDAMNAWAARLPEVRVEAVRDAASDFDDAGDGDEDWRSALELDRHGAVRPSAANILRIVRNDPAIAGRIRYDVRAAGLCAVGDELPWRTIEGGHSRWLDSDDASLRVWLESTYGVSNKQKTDDVVESEAARHPYDAVREYIESLPPWDGTPRVDTLLVDMLGAEDSAYTRAVTRKTLCAAVRRALHPGCKWDHMLIVEGDQGVGKSTLWARLGGPWFTDSLTVVDTERPKDAAEKLQDMWICEIAELDGIRKTSVESLKRFLSSSSDNYRGAYARRAESRPRRCIVVGTVNNVDGYLRDVSGNRRFWPVRTHGRLDFDALGPDVVAQVWAETKKLEPDERLYLDDELEAVAREQQMQAMETDPREGIVQLYLDSRVPAGLDQMTLEQRDAFWATYDPERDGLVERERVCVAEVWHEALNGDVHTTERRDSYAVSAMLRHLGWEPTGNVARLAAYGIVRTYQKKRRSGGGDR